MKQRVLFWLLLALIVAFSYPVRYYPITAGLDPSWAYGVNVAHAKGLIFGRDVIFNYGPLAWLALPMDVGHNMVPAVVVQGLCWLAFAALVVWLAVTRQMGIGRLAVFAACLLAGKRSFQAFDFWGLDLFLEFAALLLLGAAATELSVRRGNFLHAAAWAIGAVLLLLKFNNGVAVIGAAGMLCMTRALRDRDFRRMLRTGIAGSVGAALLFVAAYLVYCPSVSALGGYLRGMLDISSGYSSAMSDGGSPGLLFLALLVVASWLLLLITLYRLKDPTFPAAAAFVVAWYVLFKHGFVRESLHVGLFFAFVPLLWGIVLLFGNFDRHRVRRLVPALIPVLPIVVFTTFVHVTNYHGPVWVPLELDRLDPSITAAIGAAPVSIFPRELAYAAMNHLDLQPMPVLQAYQAYTPYLDGLGAGFLEDGHRAPPLLLFNWQCIDNRHPLLDVPATALAMYRNYELAVAAPNYFLLRRRAAPRIGNPHFIEMQEMRIGRPFTIAPSSRLRVARIHLKSTVWGTMRKFLFRIPETLLSASTNRGILTVRIPPDAMQDGIPLNFLPWDLEEARVLFDGGMPATRVESITITGPGSAWLRNKATVEILELP
jgi:hypothetical protein